MIFGSKMDKPQLSCVKSLNRENYPIRIEIDLSYNPAQNTLDRLNRYDPTYRDYREVAYADNALLKVRRIMNAGAVDNYTLLREGKNLGLYLATDEDKFIAIAGLMPQNSYATQFVFARPGWSNGTLRRKAKQLSEIFSRTQLAGKVEFPIDKTQRAIKVRTNNGHDFVSFWGTARDMERRNNVTFQAILTY